MPIVIAFLRSGRAIWIRAIACTVSVRIVMRSRQTRSKMPAAPMPVPTHIVTIPYFSLCRRSA